MAEKKIAILGTGRIGEALLSGLLSSGWRTRDEIVVTTRSAARAAELHERYGVEATTSNPDALCATRRRRGEAPGHRRPPHRDRTAAHARPDAALRRRRDPDGVHRGADRG